MDFVATLLLDNPSVGFSGICLEAQNLASYTEYCFAKCIYIWHI